MPNIVAFRPDRRGRIARLPERLEGAEILFFTGVRYVRVTEADEALEAADAAALVQDQRDTKHRDEAERLLA